MAILRLILKYTPAVVIALLVVTWMISVFWSASIRLPRVGSWVTIIYSHRSQLTVSTAPGRSLTRSRLTYTGTLYDPLEFMGGLAAAPYGRGVVIGLPYPLLITALLPLSVGTFIRFRFRLWQCLGYTALVATELAFCVQRRY